MGLTYGTRVNQMKEAVSQIDNLLHTHPDVDQDSTILVYFTDFGDSSLNIMVYYFANTTAWGEYLRIREDVNLKIMKIVEDMGLSIAFPTRTVHLERSGEWTLKYLRPHWRLYSMFEPDIPNFLQQRIGLRN